MLSRPVGPVLLGALTHEWWVSSLELSRDRQALFGRIRPWRLHCPALYRFRLVPRPSQAGAGGVKGEAA